MNSEEYRSFVNKLNFLGDIDKLARATGMDKEFFLVLYTQKITRDATRRFYQIKDIARNLLREWKNGRSFVSLAFQYRFPPVLMAYIIMKEAKMTRKEFWRYLKNPEEIRDKQFRREIMDVVIKDIVYSPQGMEMQFERGKNGEMRLKKWLDERKIKHLTEKELKGRYPKTPDFLLSEPLNIQGRSIHWIESKANFGDGIELKRTLRRQLKPYTEIFGEGMVVYWFGFIEDFEPIDGVLIVSRLPL